MGRSLQVSRGGPAHLRRRQQPNSSSQTPQFTPETMTSSRSKNGRACGRHPNFARSMVSVSRSERVFPWRGKMPTSPQSAARRPLSRFPEAGRLVCERCIERLGRSAVWCAPPNIGPVLCFRIDQFGRTVSMSRRGPFSTAAWRAHLDVQHLGDLSMVSRPAYKRCRRSRRAGLPAIRRSSPREGLEVEDRRGGPVEGLAPMVFNEAFTLAGGTSHLVQQDLAQ